MNKLKKFFILLLALLIRSLIRVNKKQIFCWSYNFTKYACNPRAITEWISVNYPNKYIIYWAFNDIENISFIDKNIRIVKKGSVRYFIALYSSRFIFNNSRNYPLDSFFFKKKNQKYIMTWHSSMRLKRIENDAAEQLGTRYMENAKKDSAMCDLMLSNSNLFSKMIRTSFLYNGEILENCIPRNDIFYNEITKSKTRKNVYKKMGFAEDVKIVLYAPTFRSHNKQLDFYKIEWNDVIPAFEEMLKARVEVLVKLHPNIADYVGVDSLIEHKQCHNITHVPDITEFLLAADVMISDYTSAMFDFALLKKPCFIYATDKDEYDRGFYWELTTLPFPVAQNNKDLIYNISTFNINSYNQQLDSFRKDTWGLNEDGKGCQRLYEWMESENKKFH